MTFYWTEEKLKLYKRAAENTDFNNDLANEIISVIGKNRTIYDIGCGLSYLAINLSKSSKEVNCIDIDSEAIMFLNREIKNRNINNINTFNEDFKEKLNTKEKVDCILASNFLDISENLEYLLEKAKTIIIVKNTKKRNGIYIGKKQKSEDVEKILIRENYLYEKKLFNGEFGQPLISIEEGLDYYNSYCNKKIDKLNLEKILLNRNEGEYPYYLPKYKNIGLIFIRGKK